MRKTKLDEKDYKILRELEQDGKKSLKEVSKSLDLSMTSVFERIKKLERTGTIKSYKAIISKEKLNKASTAFACIKIDPNEKIRDTAKKIGGVKGVSEVFIVNGQWDLIIKIRGKDMHEIADIVLDKLRIMKEIDNIETIHSWETVKERFDVFS